MPKPKRPKSHETQTRAEQIFEWLIGPEWTASPTKKDYGIDYEVEVFSGGEATGLTFKAQVKGHSNKPTQPKAVIKQSALNLWAALDVPVLIVSVYILSETEYKVYARWAHSYDPYPNDSKAVKTRTVRFEHDDLVGPAFPLERIQAELEAIRNARAGRFEVPIRCHVELKDDYSGIKASDLTYLLRDIERLSSGVLSLADRGTQAS